MTLVYLLRLEHCKEEDTLYYSEAKNQGVGVVLGDFMAITRWNKLILSARCLDRAVLPVIIFFINIFNKYVFLFFYKNKNKLKNSTENHTSGNTAPTSIQKRY